MKFKLFFSIFFVLLIHADIIFSQPVADFKADTPLYKTKGCMPLVVKFINLSIPTSGLTYKWDFGNGTFSTQKDSITINYTNAGIYTVKLTVYFGTDSNTMVKSGYITVYPLPNANFDTTSIHRGCIPLVVSFDTITVGGTPPYHYYWDFGDGSPSIDSAHPIHNYQIIGSHAVTLQITDTNGCTSISNYPNYFVRVSDAPEVDFSATDSMICLINNNVCFLNYSNSSDNLPLTYLWDFGDGTPTDTAQSPCHTYINMGVYSVNLTITDLYGCSSSLTKFNFINPVVSSFNIVGGSTKCIYDSVHFINTSGTSGLWKFGDGDSSILNNPAHLYSSPGSKQVSFIAGNGSICADTTSQFLVIEKVTATFTSSPTFGCQVPMQVTFTDTLPNNIASFIWHFGNGVSDTGQIATNSYYTSGLFGDSLVVISNDGCKDTLFKPYNDTIQFPVADFSPSPRRGCIPLVVSFTDLSSSNHLLDSTVSWQWNFDDLSSPNNTSNLKNPSHTFNNPGNYNVALTITNNRGCTATDTVLVQAGSPQNPQYYILNDSSCAVYPVQFYNTSTNATLIDEYLWHFSDGGTSTQVDPLDTFHGTGWMYVTLTVGYNGCYDSLTTGDSVFIKGPFIKPITAFLNCNSPYTWYFAIDSLEKANQWTWNFGDTTYLTQPHQSNPVSMSKDTVSHPYTSRGVKKIYLTAQNDDGCTFTDSINIQVTKIIAHLVIQSIHHDTICAGQPITFDATSSQDAVSFNFDFGDGTVTGFQSNPLYSHQYSTGGNFLIKLYAKDINGCTDSVSVPVITDQPQVNFIADTLIGCTPLLVHFTDLTTNNLVGLFISSWTWNFGDGDSAFIQNPSNLYNQTGVWNVTLTVEDNLGCYNYLSKNGYISTIQVTASFTSPQLTYCKGDTVHFSSNSLGSNLTYKWNFGDTTSSFIVQDTSQNPVHVFHSQGMFDITLRISDNLGCSDSLFQDDYISIQDVNADFSVANTDTSCYPFAIRIHNLTQNDFNNSYSWKFGDGSTATGPTPSHKYFRPGAFWLLLNATTSHGCKSLDSVKVTVGGPYARIVVSKDTICKGEPVIFTLTMDTNLYSINWDFKDGNGSSLDSVSHTYSYIPASGFFEPSIIYSSDSSHTCNGSDSIRVSLFNVKANFTSSDNLTGQPDSADCSIFVVKFNNTSIGATQYSWNFGNGVTDTAKFPSPYPYINNSNKDSVYNVSLIVKNNIGCTDTIKKPITVFHLPQFHLVKDTTICRGASILLKGGDSTNTSYVWSPGFSLSNSNIWDPVATPYINTLYTVSATYKASATAHSCNSIDSINVIVLHIDSISVSRYNPIIIGETVHLRTYPDNQSGAVYTWSPATGLSCTICDSTIAQPLINTTYKLNLTKDSLHCINIDSVKIEVSVEFSLDVPNAFTPNGNESTRKVKVMGWGIKRLIEFKIFDRWGNMVYSSDDINDGWDGKYHGSTMNPDTYTYYVVVETYNNGAKLSKKGSILLLR